MVINNAARTIALTNRSSVTYANGLFQETPTTITLNSTAGGHIERNGVTITSINVGVTTTRTITAVPDAGYYFTGWTKTSGTDYSISSTSTATTTITGGGAGTSGQVLTANFAPAWSVVGSGDISWTVPGTHVIDHIETAGGNTTGYVDITLSARTTYEIKLYDLTAWSEKYVGRADEVTTPITYANSGSANALNTYGGYNFFFRTAGAGTYRFTRNFTTGTLTITYPTAYSVTYNGNGSTGGTLPDTEYYTSGETVTVAAKGDLAKTNYTFDGWNTTANISGTARAAGSTFTISANTNLYAKWTQKTYTVNFIPATETTNGKLMGISRNGADLTTFAQDTASM